MEVVYLVFRDLGEHSILQGVYSTEENAKDEMDLLVEGDPEFVYYLSRWYVDL